ncbi:MAG: hypothetical protein DWQ01_22290 [Planctomycetota bacterium]|nr:MAG: hypothetical protein DWQ01_22290 [Planctomycetota bacterium]
MEFSHQDLLLHRIAEGSASAAEWDEMELLASADPGLWLRLATTLRDQQALAVAAETAADIAERVDLPLPSGHASPPASEVLQGPIGTLRAWSKSAWTGWVAAAVLALAWLGFGPFQTPVPTHGLPEIASSPAGFPWDDGTWTAADLLDQYRQAGMESGRLVAEWPPQVLSTRPVDNGNRAEVLYLRPFVERAVVDGAFSYNLDDTGRIVPVRTTIPVTAGLEQY